MMQDPEISIAWTAWESRPARIEMNDGEIVWVRPGDNLMIEYELESGKVVRFLEYRKRTLH